MLDKADWEEFASQIDILGTLWFGEDAEQQYGLALELEEYIISRGRENRHLDETLLPCEKIRLDFYWRNRDKEWALRKQAWMFPSREYMIRFFPILEKHPYLLCFCWIIRNWRFFRRICANKCKKTGFRLRVRLLDIQEKLKGMIRRRKKEEGVEEPEATSGDVIPQAEEVGFPDCDAEEERVPQSIEQGERSGTPGRDTEEEKSSRDAREEETTSRDAEEEEEDLLNEDAEEETANIEQTEGERDV